MPYRLSSALDIICVQYPVKNTETWELIPHAHARHADVVQSVPETREVGVHIVHGTIDTAFLIVRGGVHEILPVVGVCS